MIKEQEAGEKTADVCRRHAISSATFYKYKSKYGGMEPSDAKRLRALEDENGKLKIEGSYKDGKRSGRWVSYYRNGNVWAEATYRNGKEYGPKTVYYENGKVYYTGEMKNGKRVGKWKFTDIQGNTSSIDYDKRND